MLKETTLVNTNLHICVLGIDLFAGCNKVTLQRANHIDIPRLPTYKCIKLTHVRCIYHGHEVCENLPMKSVKRIFYEVDEFMYALSGNI